MGQRYPISLRQEACESVVLALSAHAAPPKHVFVVNSGDDSVSLVDLSTLREVKRFDVGQSIVLAANEGRSWVDSVNVRTGALQLVEVSPEGRLRSIGKAKLGKAPKRVAFLPASAP